MPITEYIYIHKFPEGWRVCHSQAIENIYWWEEGNRWVEKDTINPKVIREYFADSKVYKTMDYALLKAQELYEDIGFVEYGIRVI